MMISAADILNASILIVDDQEINVQLLEHMLRATGYSCITSTMDPHAVSALHRDNHYDLILLDLQMPGMDGFQVMEALKKIATDAYLPILVITAQPDYKLRALAAGAKDFISKPFDMLEAKLRIHNMLEVRLLYKQLEHYSREQESMALHDALTGLANRRLLMDRLRHALAASMRNAQYGAVMFIDLDHFKTINDTKGHGIGDLLLVEVAKRLRHCVREGDTVARLGGDEFLVVLEALSTNVDEAATQTKMIGDKIRATLSESYLLKERLSYITASIGLVLFRGHQESADDLLRYADTAMYQAKTSGRNGIRFYDSSTQLAIDARAEINDELHLALEKQQFCLHYQIQVDSMRRPIGAEVLLRWAHPEFGLIPPMQFIPLAEETGLIIPIGLWVLKTACAQLAVWQNDELTRDLTLAVNVSARQIHEADFVAQVRRILLQSGAKPAQLKLELTESTMLDNVEEIILRMHEIKMLGVSFSMDDFGTGYSSLQYLKRLPLSQIKIDQSFVRDIVTDSNDASIVQTIIAMTLALGLNVIAEGVETEAQLEFLALRGCENFQGYLFSKPVPLHELMAYLKTETNRIVSVVLHA